MIIVLLLIIKISFGLVGLRVVVAVLLLVDDVPIVIIAIIRIYDSDILYNTDPIIPISRIPKIWNRMFFVVAGTCRSSSILSFPFFEKATGGRVYKN